MFSYKERENADEYIDEYIDKLEEKLMYALGPKNHEFATETKRNFKKIIRKNIDEDTYTIVGKVFTPYYLSYEKGSSSIGSGSVNWYIYILEDHFQMDYFTEGYVTIQNVRQINSYEDAYFDISNAYTRVLSTPATAEL